MSSQNCMCTFSTNRKRCTPKMSDTCLQNCFTCSMINWKFYINLRNTNVSHHSRTIYVQQSLIASIYLHIFLRKWINQINISQHFLIVCSRIFQHLLFFCLTQLYAFLIIIGYHFGAILFIQITTERWI